MYELNDTIVALSSPTSDQRVIIRVSGPETIAKCSQVFSPPISPDKSGVFDGTVIIDDELGVDAKLYLFLAPHSYTGECLAEIHIHTNASATAALMRLLLSKGLRMAGPGEFTARSFLNGKIDLAQAEAVNEIIASSNKFQLAAAEKLLAGQLAQTTARIRAGILDCLSLIEAGLDFSGEDIEFITAEEAAGRLAEIKNELEKLLAGSIGYEAVIDMPAVGIAGATNAGKSSLLNRLLGQQRSIISEMKKTTRDVLSGEMKLKDSQCILFDCAGLVMEPETILERLSQQAAIQALQNSLIVIFCVDVSKEAPGRLSQDGGAEDWAEDVTIRRLIEPEDLIAVATKSDLVPAGELTKRITELNELFNDEFLLISVKTGAGIEILRERINEKIIEITTGSSRGDTASGMPDTGCGTALTTRHRQAVTKAIENISLSIKEIKAGNDEVAAMMLRAAHQAFTRAF
ncbi:MAG: tRNA modification GTPase [Planctomycetota bacterium]|jgi:tRNA modification GTPase